MGDWSTVQVIPVNDLRTHVGGASLYCHCKPSFNYSNGGVVVIHNAYDGREFVEYEDPFLLSTCWKTTVQREDQVSASWID